MINPKTPNKDYSEVLLSLVNSAYVAADTLVRHASDLESGVSLSPVVIHD